MVITENRKQEIEEIKEINIETKKKTSIFIKLLIIVIVLFVIIGIFSTAFAVYNMVNTNITHGVFIEEIEVGGLAKEEATKKMADIIDLKLEQKIIAKYKDYIVEISPKQIDFKYDIEKAINIAYNIGRNDNILSNNYKIINTMIDKITIPLEYSYNTELLNQTISDIEIQMPDGVEQPSYYIENDKIILIPGKEGIILKRDELAQLLIAKILAKNNNKNEIDIPVETIEPYLVDVDKFHELIYVEPKNAYYTKDPFVIYPEVIGVDFNVDEVKKMLENKQDSYSIPLIYTKPEFTKDQIGVEEFPDLLSSFSTKYKASDKNRTNNLKLASDKINGVVLLPGEEFSYNSTLGPRTASTGYKSAKIFSNGEVVDGIGGGICQISSTLYNAVLYANLEVTQRRNHQFVTSYLKAGLDATVVYGSQDFKFKNSRNYPIKIVSEVSGGVAKINIFGVKESEEYEIKIEPVVLKSNSTSIKTVTYKYRYLNGNLIDKIEISRDTYKRQS